jgi:ATP-dependent DNA helicase RecG
LATLERWPQSAEAPDRSAPPPAAAPRQAPLGPPPAAAQASGVPPAPSGGSTVGLNTPLAELRGVGPRAAEQLAQRDLHTVADLLHFLPRRYQGVSGYQALGELTDGMVASVEGQISAVSDRFVRGRRTLEVVLVDPTGSLHLVWFRVPGRGFVEQFKRGHRLRAAGSVKRFRAAMQMVHPEVAHIADSGIQPRVDVGDRRPDSHEEDVIPLYLEVEGLHARSLRRIMASALPAVRLLTDPLPETLRARRQLVPLQEAIASLHCPPQDVAIEDLQAGHTPWHRRLIYDELLALQLGLLWQRKRHKEEQRGPVFTLEEPITALAERLLPFTPTAAQSRVLTEIGEDLIRPEPMHRLLQGDVGSGKTAVALTAAYAAHRAGLQTAMMAPTELLAEQHAHTATRICAPVGMRVALLTGAVTGKARRLLLEALRNQEIHLVVGTHALIQSEVAFGALGLAIVDEQHRFGVLQRARLTELGQQSTGRIPHMLVMTATPIPRTLALTVYGDLDVSVIDALPPGRKPITTALYRDGDRAKVYAEVVAAVGRGEQAYVVFPLVEESDKEGMGEIRAAVSSAEELAAGPLKNVRLGLLHGRLTADEKEAVMRAFARHDMDVLIATTVIEVGIDVPNASVMVIEHAERFGLSQLHQLRGRVGRGQAQSVCLLLARARPSEDAWRRLEIMVQSQDGFRIAEEDLTIRGPGDFVGTRQSGLPVLSIANLARDGALLQWAREDARAVLDEDPTLTLPKHQGLKAALEGMWANRLRLLQVG